MENENIFKKIMNEEIERVNNKWFLFSFTPNWTIDEESDGSFCWHGCDKVSIIAGNGGGGS